MKITLNGDFIEIATGMNLARLIDLRKLPKQRIVVECNGEIVKSEDWAHRVLKPQDCLEIVTFVGGG